MPNISDTGNVEHLSDDRRCAHATGGLGACEQCQRNRQAHRLREMQEELKPDDLSAEEVETILNRYEHRGRNNWQWSVEGQCFLGGPNLEADLELIDARIIAAYLSGRRADPE